MHLVSLNRANRLPFYHFCYRASEAGSEFSLFEALRDSIYSEVATLISLNESRPHFLVRFPIVCSLFSFFLSFFFFFFSGIELVRRSSYIQEESVILIVLVSF